MKRLVYSLVALVLSLGILLPALSSADETNDIRSQRLRMLRRVPPEATIPTTQTASEPATATPTPDQNSSEDPTYGFTKENPVKLGAPTLSEAGQASYYYLRLLRDRNSKPFNFKRIGNVGPGVDEHIIDLYQLIDSEGVESRVYIDMYHPDIHPKEAKAPKGMTK